MFIFVFLACLTGKKITSSQQKTKTTHPVIAKFNSALTETYADIAQKKDNDITPLERFFIRSTFHHMTFVGDFIAPEASTIVRALTLMDIPPPKKPNRALKCKSLRKPLKDDTIIDLPPKYFAQSKQINDKLRNRPLGIYRDDFTEKNAEARMRYAYNPACYEITRTKDGLKKVRAYIWMRWSKDHTVDTPLNLGPFRVMFPDSLIYVAGKATPYYAQAEWILK